MGATNVARKIFQRERIGAHHETVAYRWDVPSLRICEAFCECDGVPTKSLCSEDDVAVEDELP